MKKQKQSTPYDETPDPMRDLNLELESPDDDEGIIDLEDIIEMPDRPIDEDEDLDLDVEIFDVDSDLEPKAPKAAQEAAQPIQAQAQAAGPEEEDLIKSLADEPEEDDTFFKTAASGVVGETAKVKAEPQILDDDAESLLEELLEKPAMPESGKDEEEKAVLDQSDIEAMMAAAENLSAGVEPETAISDESLAPEPSKAAAPPSAPAPPPADLSKVAEELIGRIESRLLEHMEAMVESMLPDLVRSIIDEEIEKLKQELH